MEVEKNLKSLKKVLKKLKKLKSQGHLSSPPQEDVEHCNKRMPFQTQLSRQEQWKSVEALNWRHKLEKSKWWKPKKFFRWVKLYLVESTWCRLDII